MNRSVAVVLTSLIGLALVRARAQEPGQPRFGVQVEMVNVSWTLDVYAAKSGDVLASAPLESVPGPCPESFYKRGDELKGVKRMWADPAIAEITTVIGEATQG